MLNEFRRCYPQGSLISELLAIDHGKYIVRTLVEVGGITLATGLAAADTVEAAEDRARNRALALIELNPESKTKVKQKIVATPTNLEVASAQLATPLPIGDKLEPKSTKFSLNENILELSSPQAQSSPEKLKNNHLEVAAETRETSPTADLEETITEQQLEIAETLNHNSAAAAETPPLDFSDIIAKTSLEMKRLGWTNEQGRDYLLETYGKRSRQLLSDEELIEFLHYLETQ